MDEHLVNVHDLRKTFGEQEVLKGISMQASKGDVVSIIGSSGSGKSTFLRCLNFLEQPDSGHIAVGGHAVDIQPGMRGHRGKAGKEAIRQIRAQVSMVFQHFNLWSHMTVLQNVAVAPIHVLGVSRKDATARARDYLHKVGLGDAVAKKYPIQLSGGQQQRVAIARALALQPSVLLFDEPTSALDPELVGEVLKVMQDLAREGRTMIVVTHEMGFARNVSDRVLFLREGRIEVEGSPADVLSSPDNAHLAKFLSGNLK